MFYSDRIANSTHFGIGSLPVSHRAIVVRWTPSADERPDCVSPASVRSVTRVSGCNESAMSFPSASASALGTFGGLALLFAGDSGADPALNKLLKGAMTVRALDDFVWVQEPIDIEAPIALETADEEELCFHAFNVAPRYNTVNNLYRTRQKNVR